MRKFGSMLAAVLGAIFLLCLAACANGPVSYEVTIRCNTEQGTVSIDPAADGRYEEGTEVTIAVTAREGYEVELVLVNDEVAPLTDGAYTFFVTSDTTVIVSFSAKLSRYFVTVDCIGQGSVVFNPEASDYAYGTEIALTLTADEGYAIDAVTVNGETVSLIPMQLVVDEVDGTTVLQGRYVFTVTGDTAIVATFAARQ